jgi:RNA polymerase-binding transcription factor DksA
MRYKTLFLQKLDNVEATLQMIDRAVSLGDRNRTLELVEKIREQLSEVRSAVNIEPDDFEQQFKPQ